MEIVFILVEPARGENVGAAARAIKTMGFGHLWLVNPGDLTAARWVAHHSDDVLARARHFPSLQAALQEVDFAIASTARRRLQKDRYVDADQCAQLAADKGGSVKRLAVVFGREASGLTGNELAQCDLASRIPLAQPQPSLNLGQAVMLYAWELRKHASRADEKTHEETDPAMYQHTREAVSESLMQMHIASSENLYQWIMELLPLANRRELGLVRQLLRRIASAGKLSSNRD